jgi:hypothetical protein
MRQLKIDSFDQNRLYLTFLNVKYLREAGTEAQIFDFALFWSAQDASLLVDAKIAVQVEAT